MAKVREQDHDDDDTNPESDFDNHHPDDTYPMQDSDIEELLETHGHYSAKMATPYHISKHSAFSRQGSQWWLGRSVSVAGINDHELPGLDIVICFALIQTNHGSQHAYS